MFVIEIDLIFLCFFRALADGANDFRSPAKTAQMHVDTAATELQMPKLLKQDVG